MMRHTRKPATSALRRAVPSPVSTSAPATVLRFRWIGVLVAAVAVVFAFPLLLVWQSMTTLKFAKANARIQGEIEKIHVANALVRIRIDELLSPERIEQRAKKELGLTYPRPQQIVFVTMDSTWVQPPMNRSHVRGEGKP